MNTADIDWSPLDAAPIAPSVGPFASASYLRALWRHRQLWGGADVSLRIVAGDGAAALQVRGSRVEFLGHEDLVDYRSPVGDSAGSIAKEVASKGNGVSFRFDSLPVEAADAIERSLTDAGLSAVRSAHTVAAVLDLPNTFDDYLTAIGKKERHETRRKRRRFEAALGSPRLVTFRGDDAALGRFFDMHRMAPGDKGTFMTPAMEDYFRSLTNGAQWRLDGLFGDGDRMIAAAVAWSDDSGYYLYNSAFDPSAGDASPGVVLVSMLIERAIEEELRVFDFLKGEETYKFRLGASPRQLYLLEGTS